MMEIAVYRGNNPEKPQKTLVFSLHFATLCDIMVLLGGDDVAKYEQYDTVLLKNGQTAAIVEVLASGAYIADIGHSPSDWKKMS